MLDSLQANAASGQATLEHLLELQVVRLNHIEQLLLGLATLAIAGWGYLHASGGAPTDTWTARRVIVRTVFAITFSGLVASAFNALYMGRMGINIGLLDMEYVLNPLVKPYKGFLEDTGVVQSLIVFMIPALFLPLMSLGSVWASLDEAWQTLTRRRFVPLALIGLLSVAAIGFTTVKSALRVVDTIHHFEHPKHRR